MTESIASIGQGELSFFDTGISIPSCWMNQQTDKLVSTSI
jgi:hypothetical protein